MKQIENKAVTLSGYKNVTRFSENALFFATTEQPISVALEVKDEFRFYEGGIFDGKNCTGNITINHAVLIVGYDSVGGQDYWIVKNSWGRDWGLKGYIYIKRQGEDDPLGTCAINCCGSYPLKEKSQAAAATFVKPGYSAI